MPEREQSYGVTRLVAPVNAGASLVNDTIYWGSGYSNLPLPAFNGNNKFYAVSLNGK